MSAFVFELVKTCQSAIGPIAVLVAANFVASRMAGFSVTGRSQCGGNWQECPNSAPFWENRGRRPKPVDRKGESRRLAKRPRSGRSTCEQANPKAVIRAVVKRIVPSG